MQLVEQIFVYQTYNTLTHKNYVCYKFLIGLILGFQIRFSLIEYSLSFVNVEVKKNSWYITMYTHDLTNDHGSLPNDGE